MKRKLILTLIFFAASIVSVFAGPGPGPCNDADPDGYTCPIDSWVVGFAVMVLLFTTYHLYQKQKNAEVLV
jgi:hypothetical protein